MSNRVRPLSPHLTIYRWPITMILSILHRGTGIVLTLGLLSFSLWLGSIALGEDHYKKFDLLEISLNIVDKNKKNWQVKFLSTSWPGSLLLLSLSFAFFLHLSNGIRHLYWDTGRGFNKDNVELSARIVIISTFALTCLFWWWL